jgi:hypothetical protein
LGQGDQESRTSFQPIQEFYKKNVKRIYAGGYSSFVQLDEFNQYYDD